MKISLNILTVIFMVVSSYSQSIELPQEIRTKIIEKNSIPEGVKGSPFFNDEFLIGTVYANNIKPFKAYLRYDAFNDEIQMKENKKIIALLKSDSIKVEIENKFFEIHDYQDNDVFKKGFFISLTEGGIVRLLSKHSKVFIEGSRASNSYGADRPSAFKDETDYYLNINGTLTKIELKKKDILLKLGNKKKELENYISLNKLKLKKEYDFIQLVNFYNSL